MTTVASQPPLPALLRRLQSSLNSDSPPALLQRVQRLKRQFPIEWAESRASEKQLKFQRAFETRRDPDGGRNLDIFVAMGGNRSGKSFVAGVMCFAKHLRDRAKDGDWYWCVGQTFDRSVGGQQKELWNALPRRMFGKQRWDEKIGFGMHRKIVLATQDGGRCLVEFRSADQDDSTFEQAKLDGVWIDERCPEAKYDRLLPRTVDKNAFILYSDIPEQWWHFERLKEAKPDAGVYYQGMSMYDNAQNLPEGAITKVAARMTADQQSLKIHGEFTIMEGVVYREYRDLVKPAGHLIDPFPIPPEWPRWRLIDYGGSAPTACLWVAISENENLYVYREHYECNLSVQKNAELIIAASGDEKYERTFMDPHAVDKPPAYYGSSPSVADQYEQSGIVSTGWPFINLMGEHALVQRVKFRLENNKIFVFSNCINTRREFRSWKHLLDKDGKARAKDAFENGNNHTLDCIKGFLGTNPCFTRGTVQIHG